MLCAGISALEKDSMKEPLRSSKEGLNGSCSFVQYLRLVQRQEGALRPFLMDCMISRHSPKR